jgi:hypothetical protein
MNSRLSKPRKKEKKLERLRTSHKREQKNTYFAHRNTLKRKASHTSNLADLVELVKGAFSNTSANRHGQPQFGITHEQ